MAIQTKYPSIRPTLDLNFAASQTVDPRITFSRPGTGNVASYFDSKGVMRFAPPNTPRIDFDPVTGECKGLLIEEQRTNLLTYSEQFDNAAWTKTASTITPNAVVAPDGTMTADRLVEDTSTNHSVSEALLVSSGVVYTASIYAKADTRTELNLQLSGAFVTTSCRVNLITGGVISVSGTPLFYSVTPCTNGFYRVSVTQITNAATYLNIVAYISNGGTTSYTGDGTSGLYIWGAQLEASATPSSYIKTEASQVTRAADVASMTGTNFSDWYRQDEGTFVAEASSDATSISAAQRRVINASDGTNGNRIMVGVARETGVQIAKMDSSSVEQAAFAASSPTPNPSKIAFSYKLNNTNAALNSAAQSTDTNCAVPVLNVMHIGDIASGTGPQNLNGHISRLAYYPKRLTNEQLQALTA